MRVQVFEQKMRNFKSQYEQLNDYFKVHDKDNMLDLQSKIFFYFIIFNTENYLYDYTEVIETVKVTHKNLLNEAANLKKVHESVEVTKSNIKKIDILKNLTLSYLKELKRNYLIYKRNKTGETKNIFDTDNDENLIPLETK